MNIKKARISIKIYVAIYKLFTKEETQMTEKNLKKGSISFIIRKMQFKTTLRFSIIIARMTKTIIQIATHEKV